jgi:hypothetical protein
MFHGRKDFMEYYSKENKGKCQKNLIFLAHYDSKSQTLPAFWRATLFGTSLAGSVTLIGLPPYSHYANFLTSRFLCG